MIAVILGMLANPKALTAILTVGAQLLGQFGLHVDPVQMTTVLSPLYLYVLAQAHAESGHTDASAAVTPGAKAANDNAPLARKAVAA